jgi:hypothetical protein
MLNLIKMEGVYMNTKSDSDSIVKKIILLILTIGFILNLNPREVSAKVNNNLNERINNNKIFNTSNLFDNIYEAVTGKANSYEVRIGEKVVGYIGIEGNLKRIK